MRHLLLSLLLLSAFASHAAAETRTVAIEGILIRYDDERFAIRDHWLASNGLAVNDSDQTRIAFGCAAQLRCFHDPVLIVTAAPEEGKSAPAAAPLLDPGESIDRRTRPLWTTGDAQTGYDLGSRRDFGGLSLTGTIRHSSCRARAPAEIRAFGVHDGMRYRFSSGLSHLCSGIEGFSREMFEELLGGVSLLPPGQQ